MTTPEIPFVPGLAGVPACKSSVSDIDGQQGILKYRGYAIQELAEKSTFEESALLILNGELPTKQQLDKFDKDLKRNRNVDPALMDVIKAFPKSGHPMSALQAAVAAMGMLYPRNIDDDATNDAAGLRLIAQTATIIAAFDRLRKGKPVVPPRDDLSHAANFLYMVNGEVPSETAAMVFDVCLVLHIEHSQNASTFTAMVTGSTTADPYSTMASAIGSLSGPLHGGANERVLAMLNEIGSPDKAKAAVEKKIEKKELIMGMGHREYKTMDPRATILKDLNETVFKKLGRSPLFDIALEAEKVVIDRLGARGIWPNVDFYSGIVYNKLGIETDLFTPVFAIPRMAGWVAHWREQISDNRIFRPTQLYVGPGDRGYTPIEKRG
jgi:citrate synthase